MSNSINFTHLEWDSGFFGFETARFGLCTANLTGLSETLMYCREKGYKLLYVFVDPSDRISNKAALECGGFFADAKTTYGALVGQKIYSIDPTISTYQHQLPTEELVRLTLQSGEFSRFKVDPGFTREQFEALYVAWITSSLEGKTADLVFIITRDEKMAGFVSVKFNPGDAQIGLIAVDNQFRGKQIGRQLVETCMATAAAAGKEEITVVTQGANKAACLFYEKCGFSIRKVENIYHFWL